MFLLNVLDNHPALTILGFVLLIGGSIAFFGNKIGTKGFKTGDKVEWKNVGTVFILFVAVVLLLIVFLNE